MDARRCDKRVCFPTFAQVLSFLDQLVRRWEDFGVEVKNAINRGHMGTAQPAQSVLDQ